MSDTNADQQEPSMEEILASIRRIISEDDERGEEGVAETEENSTDEPEPEPELEPELVEAKAEEEEIEDDDGVLVLTDMVEEEAEGDDGVLVLTDMVEKGDEDDGELALEKVESEPEPVPEPVDEDDTLLSFETEEQTAASVSNLVSAIAADVTLGAGDKSLEALIKEILRPLLKDWLDANLPGTVERIVREEIERVVAKSK